MHSGGDLAASGGGSSVLEGASRRRGGVECVPVLCDGGGRKVRVKATHLCSSGASWQGLLVMVP